MNEELIQLITKMVTEQLQGDLLSKSSDAKKLVQVGVSARHVHLSKEHLEILFGSGAELTHKKPLMGGQFAAEECVTIVGPKLVAIEKVRVLGPLRPHTQVEVSQTDAVKLGVKAPLRESGNIKDSASVTLVGPKGSITIKEGCLVAKRHIHMSPKDALGFGIAQEGPISVKVDGERGGIMTNVQVRIHETYSLEMHIDIDEANGLGIKSGSKLEMMI